MQCQQRLYICDPEKNIACAKKHCHKKGDKCIYTNNPDYAKQPIDKIILVMPYSKEIGDTHE